MNIPDDIALEALSVARLQELLGRVERAIERRRVHRPSQMIRGLKEAVRYARAQNDPLASARRNAARVRQFRNGGKA